MIKKLALLCGGIAFLGRLLATSLIPPLLESSTPMDWKIDEGTRFLYYADVVPLPSPAAIYNAVTVGLNTYGSAKLLKPASSSYTFAASEMVGPESAVFSNGVGGANSDNWMVLLGYDESQSFAGAFWKYFDKVKGQPAPLSFFTNRTELLIGFQFAGDSGPHYGWFHFKRPDTHFTTGFTLAASDWNPLPGEPIGAGQPPVIPVVPTVTPEGQLRLAWPAAVASWVLESSETLGPDAVWQPVPDVATNEVLLALPETSRFYRLRKP